MNRKTAYLAALKYSFGQYLINDYSRREAWQHAKRDAAYYAFTASSQHLGLARPWNA